MIRMIHMAQLESNLLFRITLETPPAGVDFGLQKGQGSRYETIGIQHSAGSDLHFECEISVKTRPDGSLALTGPFVQGPRDAIFLYFDIGTAAGQFDSPWSRRLKIPLWGIGQDLLRQALDTPGAVFETRVPGTAKDGGPNCATVKPFGGFFLK